MRIVWHVVPYDPMNTHCMKVNNGCSTVAPVRNGRGPYVLVRILIGLYLALVAVAIQGGGALASPVSSHLFSYQSSVSTNGDGALNLKAELNYDDSRTAAPIAVVMHGYTTGNEFANVRGNAQRLRDEGFFVVSVAMRGREGSDGTRDSGGVEIYDIYDAVEAVKAQYAGRVNPTNVYITGYSGGGGNVMSALTKFPDYFRAGSAFFGMSDYGYNATNGWYFKGSDSTYRAQLVADVGNPTLGNSGIQDRYMARASNLASKNNPYSEIHLFVNDNESICPVVNDTSYRDNAVSAASFSGEFDNVRVHTGAAGVYQDFNNNSKQETSEQQYWPHGYPTADQQIAAESWFLPRLLNGSIPMPHLNASDQLFVPGFLKTKSFTFWLGDGENAAGTLDYSVSAASKTFTLDLLSNDRSVTGWLEVDTQDMAGHQIDVLLDGRRVDQIVGGGLYRYNDLGDFQTLTLTALPEPGTVVLTVYGVLGLLVYASWKRK